MRAIEVYGAREHNLKNIDVSIPRERLVVVTGPSGSGKSSLAIDTVFAEGQRRFIESLSSYARQLVGQRPRPDVDRIDGLSPAVCIAQQSAPNNPRSTVATATEIHDYLRLLYARAGEAFCSTCDRPLRAWTVQQMVDRVLALPDGERFTVLAPVLRAPTQELAAVLERLRRDGFVRVRLRGRVEEITEVERRRIARAPALDVVVDRLCNRGDVRSRLADALELALRAGSGAAQIATDGHRDISFSERALCFDCGVSLPPITPRLFSFNSPVGACPVCAGVGDVAESDAPPSECPSCRGSRLRPEARAVRVAGRSIDGISTLTVAAARAWLLEAAISSAPEEIVLPIRRELLGRLGFLIDVGVEYLALDRRLDTLSGGEAQRIRLANQIGAALAGVLYVLDEPSVGLHPRDAARLLTTLRALRDRGNSLLVVEHDRDTILAADHVIDLGPRAGKHGGTVVAQGTPAELAEQPGSVTGPFLAGQRRVVPRGRARRVPAAWLELRDVRTHNLKNLSLRIPLGMIVCVTGVSGSGKSSLVLDTLIPLLRAQLAQERSVVAAATLVDSGRLEAVVEVDASPLGRTPRSCPASYVGLLDPIREFFAELPLARSRGYGASRFSFNVKGGRCEACGGAGVVRVQMHFLPDVFVTCESCAGGRYNRETLDVRYNGLSIGDVIALSVDEAHEAFSALPAVRTRTEGLRALGLGYLELGQNATTLSGGEAQRLRLARELTRRVAGRTLYVLDEPTTGLHFVDVALLIRALDELVALGGSVVVVEHNLDLIAAADHVIDLGPDAGEQGGTLVAAGTPEEITQVDASYTGRWLKSVL